MSKKGKNMLGQNLGAGASTGGQITPNNSLKLFITKVENGFIVSDQYGAGQRVYLDFDSMVAELKTYYSQETNV